MWSTPAARRALPHPPLRTEHTPIDLTHTLLVLLGCSTAPPRWAASADSHTLYLLMAARQTSIISATAPPAPAFVTNVEVDPVVSTIPVAFTIPSFEPVPTHDSSLALSARVSSQVSPRQFHLARVIHNTANRLVTATASSLLTRSDLDSLSGIFVPRSLGFSFEHSSVPATASREALFLPPLLQVFPHDERLRLSVSVVRVHHGLRRPALHSSSRARTYC